MSINQQTAVVGVAPRIGPEGFARILHRAESPAAAEAEAGWQAVASFGVDPLFALAIFHKESQFGRDGVCFDFGTRSPGNTRTSRTGIGTPVETPFRQFIRYPSWTEGWRDLAFRLVDPEFVYAQEGLRAIRPIIFKWAPPDDFGQNTELYVADAVRNMNAWGDVPCTPVRPPAFDGTDKIVGTVTFHAAGHAVEVGPDGVNRRQFADPASCETGDALEPGAVFDASYWIDGVPVGDEGRWWVTASGDRIWAGGARQKPGAAEAEAGMADAAEAPSTLPPGYVGAEDHPPVSTADSAEALRAMTSAVWGGWSATVTSEHGVACDYCGVDWPTGLGMAAHTHPGVDISLVRGTALRAAAAGRVIYAGFDKRYYRPHHVDIMTDDGEHHVYAHMWWVDPAVVQGGRVERGQYLGGSGQQTYPNSMEPDETGAHLHFEARVAAGAGERAIDPEPVLTGGGGDGFCDPSPPPAFDGQEHRIGDVVFRPFWSTVEAKVDGLRRHLWADPTSCTTGPAFDRGDLFETRYWIEGEEVQGDRRWWITDRGDRVWAGGTKQKPGGF